MAMEANSQDSRFSPDDINGKGSFQEHTEHMRMFYETHPGTIEIGGASVDRPAYPDGARTCRVALTVSETGGSPTPIETADWLSLVPMWRMALRRFSPN